jgi:hypothetical protein
LYYIYDDAEEKQKARPPLGPQKQIPRSAHHGTVKSGRADGIRKGGKIEKHAPVGLDSVGFKIDGRSLTFGAVLSYRMGVFTHCAFKAKWGIKPPLNQRVRKWN